MSQFISQPAPDVVDNLTTNDSTKALSAAQGKALNDNLTTLSSNIPCINEVTDDTWTQTLISCTGTIQQKLRAKIFGNYAVIAGRVRISITARTGEAPGIKVTLPNNKKIDGTINVICGVSSYSDAPRNGEGCYIYADTGADYFTIRANESYSNVAGNKILVFFVSQIIIKIKE